VTFWAQAQHSSVVWSELPSIDVAAWAASSSTSCWQLHRQCAMHSRIRTLLYL
jgi:hypothetical protein